MTTCGVSYGIRLPPVEFRKATANDPQIMQTEGVYDPVIVCMNRAQATYIS